MGATGGYASATMRIEERHHESFYYAQVTNASCPDRSLLDFFQVTDISGIPNIVYTVGDANAGVNLYFTKG